MYGLGNAVIPAGSVPPVSGSNCFSIFGKSDMDTCISTSIPIESMTFFVMIAAGAALLFWGGGRGR